MNLYEQSDGSAGKVGGLLQRPPPAGGYGPSTRKLRGKRKRFLPVREPGAKATRPRCEALPRFPLPPEGSKKTSPPRQAEACTPNPAPRLSGYGVQPLGCSPAHQVFGGSGFDEYGVQPLGRSPLRRNGEKEVLSGEAATRKNRENRFQSRARRGHEVRPYGVEFQTPIVLHV